MWGFQILIVNLMRSRSIQTICCRKSQLEIEFRFCRECLKLSGNCLFDDRDFIQKLAFSNNFQISFSQNFFLTILPFVITQDEFTIENQFDIAELYHLQYNRFKIPLIHKLMQISILCYVPTSGKVPSFYL